MNKQISIRKKILAGFVMIFFFAFITISINAQPYQPNWQSLDKRPIPSWYSNAKFGIFIHWGLYSVPAWATSSYADGFGSNYAEWYWQRLFAPNLKIHKDFTAFHDSVYGKNFMYQDFAPRFTCELFDPNQWAQLFKDAGAKYVVLTSKHHEGFCLWPSAQSWNWNAVDAGPHKDLAGLLTNAVKNKGLHMGFYYSLYEWFNPIYKNDVNKYVDERMLPQMKDLVTRYQPDILWTDGEWDHPAKTWRSEEYLAWLYNKSVSKETIVVNDRWGNDTKGKHGGFQTSEYGAGNVSGSKAWEETRGIGQSFGYNRNENLNDYASSQQLIHELINTVSRGGNLLLNIGPAADGTIPVIMQQRLMDIGNWLKVNGEAIYETTTWDNAPLVTKETDLFFTKKQNNVFAITTKWKKEIIIKNIGRPKAVKLLGYNNVVKFTYANNTLRIQMPLLTPDVIPCQYSWTFKIEQ
ncbi:MAG TPA: alpha-L-fucosidase [Ferruginibacter sp.]|nr:alpha-L-fucosidase [Ferruginibacter sp.]HRE63316.1 alpha-L-fucosidase [Ferruginibacter sp.]